MHIEHKPNATTRQRDRLATCAVAACVSLTLSGIATATPTRGPVQLSTEFKNEDPGFIQRIRPELQTHVQQELGRQGVDVAHDANADLSIHILCLEETACDGAQPADYAIVAKVTVDGEELKPTPYYCDDTKESELVACIVKGLSPTIAALPLQEPSPREPAVAEETSSTPPESAPPSESSTDDVPRSAIAPWAIAVGGVASAGGIAMLVIGVLELKKGHPTTRSVDNYKSTDHRPRGRLLIGVGAVTAVAGAVVVGLGIRSLRRKSPKQVGFHIKVDPRFAGMKISGHF